MIISSPVYAVVSTKELGTISGDLIFSYGVRRKYSTTIKVAYADTTEFFTVDGGRFTTDIPIEEIAQAFSDMSERRDESGNVIPATVDMLDDGTRDFHLHHNDDDDVSDKMTSLTDIDQVEDNDPSYNHYHGWSETNSV